MVFSYCVLQIQSLMLVMGFFCLTLWLLFSYMFSGLSEQENFSIDREIKMNCQQTKMKWDKMHKNQMTTTPCVRCNENEIHIDTKKWHLVPCLSCWPNKSFVMASSSSVAGTPICCFISPTWSFHICECVCFFFRYPICIVIFICFFWSSLSSFLFHFEFWIQRIKSLRDTGKMCTPHHLHRDESERSLDFVQNSHHKSALFLHFTRSHFNLFFYSVSLVSFFDFFFNLRTLFEFICPRI